MKTALEPIATLENVCKEYQGKKILNNVHFTIEPGDFCVFIGESGCGKSTLLRLLVGEEHPSSGRILLSGKQKVKPDRDCGIVFQRYSLFPHLTVYDNLMFSFRFHGAHTSPQEREALIRQMLDKIGLETESHKFPFELSGGMRQRIAVAQALLAKPRLLLMDEPFGALDPFNRRKCQDLLVKFCLDAAMTVVFVTHDFAEAAFVGSRILVMKNLKTLAVGASNITNDLRFSAEFPVGRRERNSKCFEEALLTLINAFPEEV